MAKPIPKIGSRKNGRIGSHKHSRKIPKGVIHVQASFNKNEVLYVTLMWKRKGLLSKN